MSPADPVFKTLFDDARRPGVAGHLRDDIATLKRFYLDDEQKARIDRAGRFRGAWLAAWFLLRALLLRLSPARRLFFAACLLLPLLLGAPRFRVGERVDISFNFWPLSIIGLVILIMLELKDKLVARDEIELARAVQMSLLPREHPRFGAWRVWSATAPANDVGGDLVDYVPVAPGRLGLTLGDVAGKGMAAALLSAKLQATLRALAPAYPTLDALGRALNAILVRDGLDNRFATVFYAEVSEASGHVRYLNAGHNPALVVRKGSIEGLAASSIPLGMLDGAAFREESLDLNPGDVIVVYSDGVTEAEDSAGTEFGEPRLRAALEGLRGRDPEGVGRAVLDAVSRFQGAGKPRDDQSVLVVSFGAPA